MATGYFKTPQGMAAIKVALGMPDVDEEALSVEDFIAREVETNRRYREFIAQPQKTIATKLEAAKSVMAIKAWQKANVPILQDAEQRAAADHARVIEENRRRIAAQKSAPQVRRWGPQ